MKKVIIFLLAAVMLLGLTGCGTKTLHCDGCGKEVQVKKSSNMEESWLVYCEECNKEIQPEIDAILGE